MIFGVDPNGVWESQGGKGSNMGDNEIGDMRKENCVLME